MSGLELVQVGFSVAALAIMAMIALGVLVGAVVYRVEVRDAWTAGVAASATVLLLSAPMQVLTLVHLDITKVLEDVHLTADQLVQIQQWAFWGSVAGAVGAGVVAFVYRVLLVPVSIAANPRRSPYPLLLGDVGALHGVLPALGIGGFMGVASVLLFWLLGVTESQLVRDQLAWFPGVEWDDPGVVFGVILPTVVAAAISEEMVFRGVLQRWVTRWLGGRWLGATVAILLTTACWTIAHAANTDALVVKFVQISILGVLFGVLAHRYSIESSLVAHVTLNVIAVIGAFLLGM